MDKEISLVEALLRMIGVVLLYYMGTRGVVVVTRKYAGMWYRRALVSLSFAVLFAPSLTGVGHGGVMLVPAWAVALETASRGRLEDVLTWGIAPIALAWIVFFGLASLQPLMSNNKNNKVDNHGREE